MNDMYAQLVVLYFFWLNGYFSYLYQGDIIIVKDSPTKTDFLSTDILHRERRNARRKKEYLWVDKIIPFVISQEIEDHAKLIHSAIKEFEKTTCLSFVKKRKWHQHYIVFKSGHICSSNIGRQYWSKTGQDVTLGRHCMQKGVIVHEIMHALGFWHEHTRSDRDKYVEIMWENIAQGEEDGFERQDGFHTDNMDFKYDYHSVLHYDNYAFSTNRRQTIKAILKDRLKLGNTMGLSPGDVLKINKLYNCQGITQNKVAHLSKWTDWSPCDNFCAKYRQRVCFGGNYGNCQYVNKYGVQTEMTICSDTECFAPVHGNWGRWSRWSECFSRRIRTRNCDNPKPKHKGKYCFGDFLQIRRCWKKYGTFGLWYFLD